MSNFRNSILIVSFLTLIGKSAQSQFAKDHPYALSQIAKLSETYRNISNLSFSFSYTYADSTTPTTYIEQLTGETKISNGKSWTWLDSVETIQGNQYNLSVHYHDSTMIVSDKKGYEQLIQVSFLDSLFRNANVDSLAVTTIDTLSTIAVFFKPGSLYSKYNLIYHNKKYRLDKIQYFLDDPNGTTSGTAVIELTISNYDSVTLIDHSIFNEWNFIYFSDGQFHTNPPYSYFSLYNYTVN